MGRLSTLILFIASVAAGIFINQSGRNSEIFHAICALTERNFYKDSDELENWARECRGRAQEVSNSLTVPQLIERIQSHMNRLGVSHFQIYSPAEDKKLWQGKAIDTGIRARYVEDYLIVYRVLPESGGEKAGIEPGDEILAIAGASQVTPWGAQNRSGEFTIKRANKIIRTNVEAIELEITDGPELYTLDPHTAVLEIPSFRSEFFDPDAWRDLTARLNRFSHIIIDLRENAGGNFVAMLRGLSPFTCGPKSIGQLVQPRRQGEDKPGFDDNTDDAYQIEELGRYRSIGLVTFDGYGCYTGRVTVLVGPDTTSVAEIFAHSFYYRPKSRIFGQPTAGNVVLAVWYDLPALGEGYSISIPEAVYLTPENEELENRGVAPQKEIYYELGDARAGQDTFLKRAREM